MSSITSLSFALFCYGIGLILIIKWLKRIDREIEGNQLKLNQIISAIVYINDEFEKIKAVLARIEDNSNSTRDTQKTILETITEGQTKIKYNSNSTKDVMVLDENL